MLSFEILDKMILTLRTLNLKSAFKSKARIAFYRQLYVLLRNNQQVGKILKRCIEVYSLSGKKPKAPLALIMEDVSAKLNSGLSLSESLEKWIPYQECMMLRAGEESSTLKDATLDIIKVMKKRKKMVGSIVKAFAYPTLLIFGASAVLVLTAQRVVPRLAMVSDVNSWPPISIFLMHISEFINNHGITFLAFLLLCILAVSWTVPNWSRRFPMVRVKFDNYPPFSLFRVLNGATFLMNLSIMLKAQIKLIDILEELQINASPWLKHRIESIQYNIGLGNSLGVSLELSGLEFPDRESVVFIKMISESAGSEDSLYDYAEDWLDDAVERVESIGTVLFSVGILFVGFIAMLILLGTQGMSDSIGSNF
ncbi:type II secretion system F family protein [Aeromonas veronii]|uniref:type II secretion system F family protein n=1 Tax=Aeromonas veronii TaxID=654 RepID=UPI0018810ED8|nr:type II secretion system F family protein [Aeromonas veronii]MBE8745320.1 hypothetical protein [Aeromonas veronii]